MGNSRSRLPPPDTIPPIFYGVRCFNDQLSIFSFDFFRMKEMLGRFCFLIASFLLFGRCVTYFIIRIMSPQQSRRRHRDGSSDRNCHQPCYRWIQTSRRVAMGGTVGDGGIFTKGVKWYVCMLTKKEWPLLNSTLVALIRNSTK